LKNNILANTIVFKLNEKTALSFKFQSSLKELICCEKAIILLEDFQKKSIIIGSEDSVIIDLQMLSRILVEIFKHPNRMKVAADEDIGIVWQEILLGRREKEPVVISEGIETWQGLNFLLWRNKDINASWLYLDQNNNITFKVTPLYQGIFDESEQNEIPCFFDEFLKSYHPIAELILSYEQAQQWLKQANEVVEIIQQNIHGKSQSFTN